ncbi:sporulation and cell division repeat protein [Hallella bergensis DSM 17361]|uniref:Sporulation and cell division repeat protein n=1 Tax=Hallella bergensis DSM 17361 TaxID=585502 RepID=D1PY16_9BACT|nr:SPOR domain-containing protein [Hallella bergensis]EFA43689.1 sporulation and cell division repeat protein [Hallella bergensis DSM 17361]
MKKSLVLGASMCIALAFTSCKSQESAYKKAYEKAKAQEEQNMAQQPTQEEAPVVTPLTQQPVTQTTVSNVENATVRTEDVTIVSGVGLQAYSVVVGSFGLKANAEGLQTTLKQGGYDAQIAYNSTLNMYRVIATTSADKAQAVQSRDALRGSQYNPKSDAWLLYKK